MKPKCKATALVTGASSGIGLAVANALLGQDYVVYGTSRCVDKATLANPAINWLEMQGHTENGINTFVDKHEALLAGLEVLINNAGSASFGDLPDYTATTASELLHLLSIAPIRLTMAVFDPMRQRNRGTVINVSSLAALFPLPYMAGYCAGKAALSSFTRNLILTHGDAKPVLIDFQAGDFKTPFNKNMQRLQAPILNKPGSASDPTLPAWHKLEQHLNAAPPASIAARDMLRCIRRGRSGTVRSGGWFQCRLAPLAQRLLPQRLFQMCLRRYYGLTP